MNYKIIPTDYFKQQVRKLSKKYSHIKEDLQALNDLLKDNPRSGKPLGKKAYKIRLRSSDMGRGKRGGYRAITYVHDDSGKIRLLTIYAKPRKTDISDDEIRGILEKEGML